MAVVVRQHVMYASSVGPVRRRLPHTLERWQPGSRLQDLAHLKDGWPILWEWNLGLDQQVRPRDLIPFFPMFCRGIGCVATDYEDQLLRIEDGISRPQSWTERHIAQLGQATPKALADMRTNYADYHMANERAEEAVQSLRRAVELESWSAKRWNNLGVGLSSIGRLNDAIVSTQTAVDLAPNDVLAQVNLSRYQMLVGQTEPARQRLLKVVETNESATAYALLGVIAGNENGLGRARKLFERALSIDPTQPEALSGLKTLKERQPVGY